MRWSHYLLSAGVLCALSLTACKQTSNSGAVKVAGRGGEAQTVLKQDQMDNLWLKILAQAESGTPEQKAYYQKSIAPLIGRWIGEEKRYDAKLLSMLDSLERELSQIELTEVQQKFVKALILFEDVEKSSSNMIAETYFKGLYAAEGLTLGEALQKEVGYMKNLENKVDQAVGAQLLKLNHSLQDRALSGQGLSSQELTRLMGDSSLLRFLEKGVLSESTEVEDLRLSEREMKDFYAQAGLKEKILEKMRNDEKSAGFCEKLYYRSISVLPQEKDLVAFQAKAEALRDKALLQVSPQDSSSQRLKNSSLRYIPSYEEGHQAWLKAAAIHTEELKERTLNLDQMEASTRLLTMIVHSLNVEQGGQLCEGIVDVSIPKESDVVTEDIFVNWTSLRNPSYGMTVLAQQLGRLVFAEQAMADSFATRLLQAVKE